ncbi:MULTISPECIES: DUF4406 domain-containing protein [unclassified Campylobacter]|uniref:DUF4406 domain-containing protein n=1 Tax=unclassified Campylobacter TaxID=2593542 RepID=UPI0022E9B4F5|nr:MULTISPECIES: DUF4406 domain-containing protein [unclassified Campylobacter]MDA3056443.1 DUF4406 domain-containing protein [Campylobacter sp. CN_NA1]MDA3069376.1 DUF4406 domain-containing protein [Campylobacter sp. CN_NE3]
MTKKAMISMPMNGKHKCDIEANFNRIKAELEAKGYEVIDSVIKDFDKIEAKNKPIHCLSKSIAFLSEADLLYCAKGWQKARGCKIEHEIAVAYGLEVIYEYVL